MNSELQMKQKAEKNLLWLGIISIVMFFGGLTSAYVVSIGSKGWLDFDRPLVFWGSTLVILASSLTLYLATEANKKNDTQKLILYLWVTLGLGLVFTGLQFVGWGTLIEQNIVLSGKYTSSSYGYFYVITFLHFLHILSGLIVLGVTLSSAYKNKYSSEHAQGLKLCATYWHFLDVLWVYLFLFLVFIK